MHNILIRYAVTTYIYGTVRAIAYAPPLKRDEYVTDRVGFILMHTISAPLMAPGSLFKDLKNLEHVIRKMPGPIDRSPWSGQKKSRE
jgi:hypothetical protein